MPQLAIWGLLQTLPALHLQGAHRYTYSRAVRLVTRADAGEPPAQLAGVLAPELCTPEAVRELMADAGPGGRLLLCRVYAWRCTWPEGYRGARRVAAVLELVNPLDGKLAPEWEGGLELAQEAEGWEWHQTLVPVLWSAERGIIQALPDAAGKPSGSGVFKPYRVGTTDREFLSWCVDSDGEGELWFDVTGYSEDGEDELELSEDLWNRVVVEDEGVPVRLALLVPHGKRT